MPTRQSNAPAPLSSDVRSAFLEKKAKPYLGKKAKPYLGKKAKPYLGTRI